VDRSHDVRRGVALALGTAIISGLSVYLNAFAVKAVPDAVVYTTGKNAVAAVVLIVAALALPGRIRVPALGSRQAAGLLAIAIVGGSVPFVLFFSGLAIASAPAAAFIHKTLFLWVAVLAVPFLGERLGLVPIIALVALLAGQALITPPNGLAFGAGEAMIAAATGLWAIEVIVAKRLLGSVPVRTVAVARMGLGVACLLGYLVATGRLAGFTAVATDGWLWMAVTGAILAGYVGTWFAALREAPATLVTSILVVGAVITGVLSAVSRGALPDPLVVGGYLLVAGGAIAVAWTIGSAVPRPVSDRAGRPA
jgi:drug/metabolite transporter (DMT)-like permease